MEKYLVLILLSAPGFIAKFVARCLGDSSAKRGEFDSVLIYFSYSLLSLSLTLIAAWIVGLFSFAEPWSILESEFKIPLFSAKFLLLSLICSTIIGASWRLFAEDLIVNIFNYINKKMPNCNNKLN